MVFITCLQNRLDLTPRQSMATKALISFGGENVSCQGVLLVECLLGRRNGTPTKLHSAHYYHTKYPKPRLGRVNFCL